MSEHTHQHDRHQDWADAHPGRATNTPPPAARLGRDGRTALEQAVKNDVIPRLMALARPGRQATEAAIPTDALRTLVNLCLEPAGTGVLALITGLHRAGADAASLYERLLTPAARELGEMWETDNATFADVTIGVLRLQNAQRAIAARPLDHAAPPLGTPRALLLAVPGEQHTFGLSIVLDFFVRAGWEARMHPPGTREDALAMIRRERAELIGLSFACDDRIPEAAALITAIRKAAPNRNLIVLVGGPSFVADPALAGSIGADATASDGHGAVLRANELLQLSDGRA